MYGLNTSCIIFLSQGRIVISVNHVQGIFTQLAHPDDSLWIEKEQSLQEGATGSFFVDLTKCS